MHGFELFAGAAAVVFLVLGLLLCAGKGQRLFAVFMLMTPSEQHQTDMAGLCRSMGPVMLGYAGGCALEWLYAVTAFKPCFYAGLAVLIVCTVLSVRYRQAFLKQ